MSSLPSLITPEHSLAWVHCSKGNLVKKQDGEAKNAPFNTKAKNYVSLPSAGDPDLIEKLASINVKLIVIKDSLTSM